MKKIFTRMMMLALIVMCASNAFAGEIYNRTGLKINKNGSYSWWLGYDYDESSKTATLKGLYYEYQFTKWSDVEYKQATIVPGADLEITIPATIDVDGTSYAVTAIGEEAFTRKVTSITYNSLKQITKVDFSQATNLKTIGKNAFRYLTEVSGAVNLPYGVTSIGETAFYNSDFTSVDIPETVMTIGSDAFKKMDYLENVTLHWYVIPSGVNGNFLEDCAYLDECSINYPVYVPLISQEWYTKFFTNYDKKLVGSKSYAVVAYYDAKFVKKNVTSCTLGDGNWSTVCFDRPMKVPAGVTVYAITEVDTAAYSGQEEGGDQEGTGTLELVASEGDALYAGAYLLNCSDVKSVAKCGAETASAARFYEVSDGKKQASGNWLSGNIMQIPADTTTTRTPEGVTSSNIGYFGYAFYTNGAKKAYCDLKGELQVSDTDGEMPSRYYCLTTYSSKDGESKIYGLAYQSPKVAKNLIPSLIRDGYEDGEGVIAANPMAFLGADSTLVYSTEEGSIKTFNFVVKDETTTAITEVNAEKTVVKEGIYDLAGRRLQSIPEKGVFIVNGKKYIK